MTRQEFMDQVLAPLGRLTADEQQAVQQELEEHIEDRMEVLLEMGWAEETAEERCLEAMGDPAEIGREMAKQYRGRWWIWLGRAAAVLTAVLCVQAVLGLGTLGIALAGLEARISPDTEIYTGAMERTEITKMLDIRTEIGNDILRIIRVSVGETDGQRAAAVLACMYDRRPFGIAADNLLARSGLKNERGESGTSGGGRGGSGAGYAVLWAPIEPEDTFVVWEYRAIGGVVRVEVPLPVEGET